MPSLFHSSPALQMHTIVSQPLTRSSHGRISCCPIGLEPIVFEWTGPNGRHVEVDASGSEAYSVVPGSYRVRATDASGATTLVAVDVEPVLPDALVVNEYRVTPATTGMARDGVVEAVGIGLEEGWRFLWTHGAETDGPVLRHAPCGTYSLAPLPKHGGDLTVPTMVHQCAPARVSAGVRR